MVVSSVQCDHMDLLNESAKNLMTSYLAKLSESQYQNNIETSGHKLVSLKNTIKHETYQIKRNNISTNEAKKDVEEAARVCNTKRIEYERAQQFVETVKAQCDEYLSASSNIMKSKVQHELDTRILETLKVGMEYIVNSQHTQNHQEILPYAIF